MWAWLTPLVAAYGAVVSTWLAVGRARPRVHLDTRPSNTATSLIVEVENSTDYTVSIYGMRTLWPREPRPKLLPYGVSTEEAAKTIAGGHVRRVIAQGKTQDYQLGGAERGIVALISWRSHSGWRLFHFPLVLWCSPERMRRLREQTTRGPQMF